MTGVVVDTDVVSYAFKRDRRIRFFRPHFFGRTLIISFMTFAELRLWPEIYRWGTVRRDQLQQHIGRYEIRHSDEELCDRWAAVVAEARNRGRPIDVADAWIAATALELGVPLVTNNAADFDGVKGLRLLTALT